MALKGIDIFKMSPKKNCKECGVPTCMAFSMKVAAGAKKITDCPYMGADVVAKLSEATAPPMKTINVGPLKMGGETVLFRHEKTFVSKTLYAVAVADDADVDAALAEACKVDYERIGEKEHAEFIFVEHNGDTDAFVEAAKKAAATGKEVILDVECPKCAEAALAAIADKKPVLNGATAENVAEFNALATKYGVVLGVKADTLDALYELTAKIEGMGNKNLILNASTASIKSAFEFAVQIRRACLAKNPDRTFGYPVLVNAAALAAGDQAMQTALASLFTMKYGSVVVMESMTYAQALPLFGLRQNLFTDPQKPMKVAPGIYPLNGADENAVCSVTVDFALTYFVVSGELERSGVPVNMCIVDAGGYSVLTAWAAGKLSSSTIAKFITENVQDKIKNHTLILPGKVAVLQGEVKDKLPGWNVVIGPREAVELVQFMKEFA